ncbi:hypothetical protein AJ78_03638 [Emergomyces pasteurianus Ep9510]|uniref:Carboxylic ester hydrolase n=1 Tax=Emergomyces pasteurianus Ep9510 TaxID=1447872 RepID=A0A1J9PJJ0_9EURO|nr:hypothetical protein AJ78_03638 [Emergomyces pasteurianus Ep9510]
MTRIDVHSVNTTISGFVSPQDVANFLGIKFAEVTERFRPARPVPLASLGPSVAASQYGPRCPQPVNHGRMRRSHLYEGVIESSNTPVSEYECLRLNIYAPAGAVSARAMLPVMVWIHGGGFVFGDANSEYDGNYLVEESGRLGKPFIFVTLNYRLGYYGFLSSRELAAEARSEGEEYYPNPGLYDQRLGLEWVRDNISLFGGDPDNVTIAGQSAGAWSALSHLVSDVPLCRRGFVMSATVISFPSEAECQETFDQLVARAGTSDSATVKEKLAALRAIPDHKMSEYLDGALLLRPAWDPKWFSGFPDRVRLDQIESLPVRVDGLLIGSMKDETANIRPAWSKMSVQKICEAVDSVIPDESMKMEILNAYELNSHELETVVHGIVKLTSESFFSLFPEKLGNLNGNVMVLRFDQTDTFEQSVFKGSAYHCLDLPFLCRFPAVAGEHATVDLRETTRAFTTAISKFVNGHQPWEPFHQARKFMILNGSRSGLADSQENEVWRRFFTSEERARCLVDTGRLLMTYKFN